ncbi:MAG: ATP-binding protein [Comamonadaceae bacterium]|nr:ATP-binding protein [Pseudomonadota bacterium]MDE2413586.1 ATP-binding protein [Comamonadaceae bacterium]
MFRTRPPAYALACAALCLIQLLVNLLLVLNGDQWGHGATQRWQVFSLGVTGALAILILLQLPRALQWRPRRSIRPSHELKLERQRIARDLHDQVGSQLVHAMALVDPGAPATQPLLQTLEHCLLDLRLLVDSMDGDDDALSDRLARLRHRIQPVLDHRGIALDWDVLPSDAAPMPVGMPARELTAIVQEALSNVLQHASATAVAIRLEHVPLADGGAWRLQVVDNGKGLAHTEPTGSAAGHGIAGMRLRAADAGAVLELLPAPGQGLCVQVTLPEHH